MILQLKSDKSEPLKYKYLSDPPFKEWQARATETFHADLNSCVPINGRSKESWQLDADQKVEQTSSWWHIIATHPTVNNLKKNRAFGLRREGQGSSVRIYDRLFFLFCLFLMLLIYVCVVFVSLARFFYEIRLTSCLFLMVEIVMWMCLTNWYAFL